MVRHSDLRVPHRGGSSLYPSSFSREPPEFGEHHVFDGRYVVHAPLHRGQRGEFYEVLENESGQRCALKTLMRRAARHEEDIERFCDEIEALERVQPHANIIRYVGQGRLGDQRPFLVMELAPHRGELPLDGLAAACQAALSIANALDHIHQRGIVHRNVTPSNIVRGADGQVKLIDFGSAFDLRRRASERMTAHHEGVGTLEFMPPEQFRLAFADPAADYYALGATLFCWLTGILPFPKQSKERLLQAKLSGQPAFNARFGELPRSLQTFLMTCMHPDPSERIADRQGFAAALHGILNAHTDVAVAREGGGTEPVFAAESAPATTQHPEDAQGQSSDMADPSASGSASVAPIPAGAPAASSTDPAASGSASVAPIPEGPPAASSADPSASGSASVAGSSGSEARWWAVDQANQVDQASGSGLLVPSTQGSPSCSSGARSAASSSTRRRTPTFSTAILIMATVAGVVVVLGAAAWASRMAARASRVSSQESIASASAAKPVPHPPEAPSLRPSAVRAEGQRRAPAEPSTPSLLLAEPYPGAQSSLGPVLPRTPVESPLPSESPTPPPSSDAVSPTPLPSGDAVSPTPLPSSDAVSPTPLPSSDAVSPTPLPSSETPSPAQLPPADPVAPTAAAAAPSAPPLHETAGCEITRQNAAAAAEAFDWKAVVARTSRSGCWEHRGDWERLRSRAFIETQQWERCTKFGKIAKTEYPKAAARMCEAKQEQQP